MAATKRASTIPTGPKPPTTIAATAIIAEHANLTGTHRITVGDNTVLHPRAKISSVVAPVTIGQGCIICERTVVGMRGDAAEGAGAGTGTVIEDAVQIEAGVVVEASRVGKGSVIEVKARIGRGAVLGQHCKIGPLCEVAPHEVLPDHTILYGTGQRRIDRSGTDERRVAAAARHVEALRKLIPSHLAKWASSEA